MSIAWIHLLAQDGEDSPVAAIIFFVIFAFVSLINWLQKRQQEKRQRQMQVPPPPVPQAPQEVLQQQIPRRQMPKPRPPQRKQQPKRQQPARVPNQRQQAPRTPPPAPVEVIEPLAVQMPDVVAATEISEAAPRRAASAAVSAARIRHMLSPRNARGTYILTELLQPPVSLRERS